MSMMSMRRGTHQAKKHHGAPKPPADLLVCFPTRAHLTIKPKQICSPARLSDPTSHRTKHLTKISSARFRTETSSSPVSWAKDKRAGLDGSEPSSPKVTCAGQIKVRRKSADSSWQSVMEEIERIHIKNKRQKKKRASWGDALGFKKEVIQFLTCLRTIKLDFRCFGAMPECDISSDEEDEDEEADHEHGKDEINQLNSEEEEDKSSGTKWVVFLQENQDTREPVITNHVDQESESLPTAPPPNALLLMRCRSAPAKSWLENRAREIVEQEERDKKAHQQQRQQQENEQEEVKDEEEDEMFEKTETEENQKKKKKKKLSDYLLVMDYDTDFYELSNDIANETWVVGSINPNNPFSRSRSWKR